MTIIVRDGPFGLAAALPVDTLTTTIPPHTTSAKAAVAVRRT
jgi:hypothetical protein